MPGTRHAKNNTALGYFTRHERAAAGWGSQKKRLAKEAIKPFYACTQCLKVCEDPLICPQGDLFCRECIYQSLLTQKLRNKEKLREYVEQQKLNQQQAEQQDHKSVVDKFLQNDRLHNRASLQSKTIALTTNIARAGETEAKKVLDAVKMNDKQLSCFWIPSLTPNASVATLKAPDTTTYCPGCNKPLKRKQLSSCKFTMSVQDNESVIRKIKQSKQEAEEAAEVDNSNISAKHKKKKKKRKSKSISDSMTLGKTSESNLFECGSCSKPLSNATRSACLSKCGHVVCVECVKKFVAKSKSCMVCDEPCKKKHVIFLTSGGTGFAAHDNQIEATRHSVAFQ